MPRLHWAIWGKKEGNFRPSQVGDYELQRALERESAMTFKFAQIISPRCDFTNKIESFQNPYWYSPTFHTRTYEPCDGVVVLGSPGAKRSAALFNADCPMIAVCDIWKERFAVLHGGYRCLLREDGSDSIIKVLFREFGFQPKFVEAFVGFGIGNCCFGAEHYSEMKDSKTRGQLPISTASKSPREGQRSIDLRLLALQQLSELGVPLKSITIDFTCTACADGGKKYHSNCYDGPDAGRNCALAWLE